MHWPQLSSREIKTRLFDALAKNANYRTSGILGIPATYLDEEVFYEDAPFLKDAPFLSLLIANPNHIGCHTLPGEKEPIFRGTQELEADVIRICADEVFRAEPGGYDGYVASGGTEGNIEAAWLYRNYFMNEHGAQPSEIALVYSADSHYSFSKASNLLNVQSLIFHVDPDNRTADTAHLRQLATEAASRGVKYFIVNVNMGTTMFGSIDDPDSIGQVFEDLSLPYMMHVDAAFGGFIHPFTSESSNIHFANPRITSISIDAHKMLQTPYGTGIFLVRKNLMQYVCTSEASYVMGKDYTLVGSRSGANAACIWMVLHTYGCDGWKAKVRQLAKRTDTLCDALADLNVRFYRAPSMNIVTIRKEFVPEQTAKTFCLVPDNHENPSWYKIVLMPHVKQGTLDNFLLHLKGAELRKSA